jgi:hypothetical protein
MSPVERPIQRCEGLHRGNFLLPGANGAVFHLAVVKLPEFLYKTMHNFQYT